MKKKKKTLYEILDILPNASDSEIWAAHQRLSDKFNSIRTNANSEDVDFKLKVIDVAFRTLSVQRTRDAYDVQLASLNAPANVTGSHNAVALIPEVSPVTLKADAVLLKADAMSLKADAMMLKADAMSLATAAVPVNRESGSPSPLKRIFAFGSSLKSPLTKVLTIIGSMIAAGLAIQAAFLLMFNYQVEQNAIQAEKANEQVRIQEYYQTYGVRPAGRIEADLLEAENRRKENERYMTEREQQQQEDEYRQFVESSRREGDRISENLRLAEERERNEEARKQEQLRQELERAERNRIEADRLNAERERRKLGINTTNTQSQEASVGWRDYQDNQDN